MILNIGKDAYQYVMDSGNFKIFRKLQEEEKQLVLFCTDCDCEEGCQKVTFGCSDGECKCRE